MPGVDVGGRSPKAAVSFSYPRTQPTPNMSTDTPPPAAAPANEDRTVAILTYITIIGFIIAIVMHSSKKTALGTFHLRQGLGLFITCVVCWIPGMIIAFIPVINLLMILMWPLFGIAMFVLYILASIFLR